MMSRFEFLQNHTLSEEMGTSSLSGSDPGSMVSKGESETGGEKAKKGHVEERAVTVGDPDSSPRAAEGRVLQETQGTLKC